MSDPVSFVECLPDYSGEAILGLLKNHPEIHRTSPVICYLVRIEPLNGADDKPIRVEVTIAEIDRLENHLPGVFNTLEQKGKCYIISKVSPNNYFKMNHFWDVFEEQTLKKDSALIIAKIAFRLVMWLIHRMISAK